MKKLLTDIELDFYELKCLLDFLDTKPEDDTLYKVAERSLSNLTGRMGELTSQFNNSYSINTKQEALIDKKSDSEPTKVGKPKVEEAIIEKESVVEPVKAVEVKMEESEVKPSDPVPKTVVEAVKRKEEKQESESSLKPAQGAFATKTAGIYRALSLNDVFRYSRELFNGDTEFMRTTLAELDDLGSYEQAIGHLVSKLNCDLEDLAFQDMDDFLKRYFS